MKNYPLSFQIWVVIAIVTLFISGVLVFILPHTLRGFFTTELYATIQAAQENFNSSSNVASDEENLQRPDFFIEEDLEDFDVRTVKHFIIHSDGRFSSNTILPLELAEISKEDAFHQKQNRKNYDTEINGEKIFYTISKAVIEQDLGPLVKSEDVYLVSYLNDSYREDLVQTLFKKLVSLTIIILILSWIPAVFFSRYLSNPIVGLEKKVKKLTNREWSEEIIMDRKDEIGKLGDSIEKLRLELIRQDQAEQSFLQNISHELKTPIMVVASYTQAIADGIYPEGSLESSLKIISEETDRLEERVQSLLYLTKLDYMANFQIKGKDFYLDEILKATVNKLSMQRPDLSWVLDIKPRMVYGDREQMQIVFENLLDNAMRYADKKILVELKENEKGYYLRFWNDGVELDEDSLVTIFEKFHKGRDGEIGLGLAIAKRIVEIHRFKIYAKNEDNGVSFYIDNI